MLKLLYDPKTGRTLVGQTQHAQMVRPVNFDEMVRALYWPEKNVVYFRYWAPDGLYQFSESGAKAARLRCERALLKFKDEGTVDAKVKVLFWETGYGVTDLDIRY